MKLNKNETRKILDYFAKLSGKEKDWVDLGVRILGDIEKTANECRFGGQSGLFSNIGWLNTHLNDAWENASDKYIPGKHVSYKEQLGEEIFRALEGTMNVGLYSVIEDSIHEICGCRTPESDMPKDQWILTHEEDLPKKYRDKAGMEWPDPARAWGQRLEPEKKEGETKN